MREKTRSNILHFFKSNSGYVKTKEVIAQGFHHKYLRELEEDGTIIKIKNGLYSLTENENYNSLYENSLIIPRGVFCLGSALSFYDLSTWDPPEVHMAIPRGMKVQIPENLPIKLYYFSGRFFETGKTEVELESGQKITMYDIEKTICDIIRYRNRIGIDIMKEALNEYLKLKNKNLNILYDYAGKLGIKTILDNYMDVLI
jgi:predicted transcriptional regulator of viral defense system